MIVMNKEELEAVSGSPQFISLQIHTQSQWSRVFQMLTVNVQRERKLLWLNKHSDTDFNAARPELISRTCKKY